MSKGLGLLVEEVGKGFTFPSEPIASGTAAKIQDEPSQGQRFSNEESLQLVQRLFFVQAEESPRVVAFAGIEESEGCSSICAAVAETLARITPGTVCLLEANFRMPTLPTFFASTKQGFNEALHREGPIRSFATQVSPGNLWFIAAGTLTMDSPGALGLQSLRTRLAELRSQFDYVIIDVAPLNRYADALSIGRWIDGMVMVLEANTTRRETAQNVVQSLRSAHIDILGAVLNNHTSAIPARVDRKL